MPISNYNPAFGGKAGSAQKAYDAIIKRYGLERGKRIFYALVNERLKGARKS